MAVELPSEKARSTPLAKCNWIVEEKREFKRVEIKKKVHGTCTHPSLLSSAGGEYVYEGDTRKGLNNPWVIIRKPKRKKPHAPDEKEKEHP